MHITQRQIENVRKGARTLVREFGFFQTHFEDSGATHGETHVLIELKRLERLEVGEIARILNMDKSVASKLLSAMRTSGWVDFDRGLDSRKKLYFLTAAGRHLASEIDVSAHRRMANALSELSVEEREVVEQGMELLAGALKRSRARRDYRIRRCRPSDDHEIASIVRRSLKDFGFAGPGTAAADPSLDSLSSFNRARQCYLIAERDGHIFGGVGIASLPGEDEAVCELIRMFLHPDARSTGLAQLLLEEALTRARNMGYQLCYLETTEHMQAAQSLYRKYGFRYVKQRRGKTGHFACDVLMEMAL